MISLAQHTSIEDEEDLDMDWTHWDYDQSFPPDEPMPEGYDEQKAWEEWYEKRVTM